MVQKKVMITCDSTCDLSEELTDRYGITVNPLFVVKDNETLKDGIDIKPDDIFAYYEKTGQLIKTVAPNMQDFIDFFSQFTEKGYSVVHFTISASMSGTFNNARLAADQLEDVYIIDSKCLSTGAGLEVLRAADLAADGKDAADIAREVSPMWERIDASFVVDTLEYLHKGGRCSSVAALGANLLKLKPCIEVKNGEMGVGKKYRGKLSDVLQNYTDARLSDISDIETDRIFVTHSGCDENIIAQVVAKIKSTGNFKEIFVTRAGCAVSVHCGPNTLGILFVRKSPLKQIDKI